MMYRFLANNRDELIERCKAKVAQRPNRAATEEQLKHGVPSFLDQVQRTLKAEEEGDAAKSVEISGAAGGTALLTSEMGVGAATHGGQLLKLGYSVNQVVHDYGDLCQAITELAFERDAPFTVHEFQTLNRCLDNAIADAVTEFSLQRDAAFARQQYSKGNERIGFLAHELRNSLGTANLAVNALEKGNLAMSGATGTVLKRSLAALDSLIERSLAEVRVKSGALGERQPFSLEAFIKDATEAALLGASAGGCHLQVSPVEPLLILNGNRDLLLAALANLIQNAFKFTHPGTEITLSAYAVDDRLYIDVKDHCGGLPHGDGEKIFTPFSQRGDDRTGLGLGLSIARKSVEADEGTLTVRDMPGTGCVFTMNLPRHGRQDGQS